MHRGNEWDGSVITYQDLTAIEAPETPYAISP